MKIVCAADCGIDRHIEHGIDRAGGIGLNVAVHARRRCAGEASVTLVAPIGDDAEADLVRDAATRAGLATCFEVVPGATPVQRIRQARDGERVFERFDEGVLGGFRVSDRQRTVIAGSDVLATAAFEQGLTFFESVLACKPQGLTAVDFTNANDVGDPIAFAAHWAPELDIGFFGLRWSDGALIDALERVAADTHRLFVVTLGPDGSLALSRRPRLACAAQPIPSVVDTTGAGDAFTAGFLCEYAHSRDIGRSLELGTEVAASTLRHLSAFELD
jgi:fructoselysine 6-kinase